MNFSLFTVTGIDPPLDSRLTQGSSTPRHRACSRRSNSKSIRSPARLVPVPSLFATAQKDGGAKDERRRRGKVNATRVPHHGASSHASSFMRSWERASRWVRSTPSSLSLSATPLSLILLPAHVSRSVYLFLSCPPSVSLRPSRTPRPAPSPSRLAPVSTSSPSEPPSRSRSALAPAIPHPRPLLRLTLFSLIIPPSCCRMHSFLCT